MEAPLHKASTAHLPIFITAPGHTDVLMVITGIFLLSAVVGFGVVFFWVHSLPERIAHKTHKLQLEVVAVLGLLALFTHIHLFWVIALLLALIDIPDVGGWMSRIATSTEKIAGVSPPAPEFPERPIAGTRSAESRDRVEKTKEPAHV